MARDRLARFMSKARVIETGCWEWTGYRHPDGYGQFRLPTGNVWAHRWSYEHFVGPIPEGLTIDHLCRVRACVNPTHLEPVPLAVNVLRGIGLSAANARKTECKRGHEFSTENTYRRANGRRECRTCGRIAVRRWTAEHPELKRLSTRRSYHLHRDRYNAMRRAA